MSSAFTPEQWAYLEAHKNDSRVHEIRWCYSVPIPVSILSTAFRLWAKKAGRNGIRLDDYLIIFATICLVGECASGLGYGPPHGMGRHINAVSAEDLKIFRKGDYVFSHFYDMALGSVKLAILAFYYRVFIVPIFQRIVLATAAFVVCWEIAITVTLALVCRPINTFWDDSVKGTCLNLVTFTYFTNISNLATDIWIFLLPIPVILRLQLPLSRKIGLCAIFSVGLATCVVSAIRITVVLGHGSPDFTWATVSLGAYSVFEPLGGILCTNLPIIWHMYRKIRSPLKNTSYSKQTQSTRPSRPSRQHSSVDESPNRWLPLPASSSQVELTKDGKGLQLDPTVVRPKPAEFWNSAERNGEDEEVGIAVPMNSIVVEREFRTEVTQNPESKGGVPGLRKNVYEVRKR
ncbi:uncharacterized protein K441DRAFT_63631 [Cenococcum geophilum 1.58]|uniref:uncharacterized protein n=1 Tax=Cenococcum geophilum 1.58 TaxID=794803 RepID=UPI00358FE818|nr:hypothetical protein K441DRAFT_63631 [Cenococcum geophilum 1.58]